MTGREAWHRRVAQTPGAPFLVEGDRTWTWAEADDAMRRLATGLQAAGAGAGTRVLVGMDNRAQTVLVHAALRELGGVLVPLLPGLTFGELRFQIDHSEGELLLADPTIAETVVPHLGECPQVRRTVLAEELDAMAALDPLPAAELDGHHARSPWAILYTSGSSGTPKGVVMPAGAIPTVGEGYATTFGITAEDTYFLPLTMAHAVGALTAQGVALHTGCRLVVVDRFSPSRFWDQVEATGATCSILFPGQLNLLLEVAGGASRETTLTNVMTHMPNERFERQFGARVGVCWGMTETGAHSTGGPAQPGGYVGHPMTGVEVAVLDAEHRPLPPGETGEIALRHDHVMLEYLKQPEETARTLVDGWILSGDLGTVSADGGLFYGGRSKTMIKRSGESISPEEIEAALTEHPDVVEALVFAVADPIRTEEIAVVVVTRGALDPEALTGFLREHLARWKLPRYVDGGPTGELPRLANGKVDRLAVIASLDPATAWDRERAGQVAR